MVASLNLMLGIWRNGDCRGYSLLIPIFPFSFKEKKYRGWSSKEDLSADYFDGTDFTLPLLSVHTSIFEVVASVPRKRLCGDLVSSAFFFFFFSFSFFESRRYSFFPSNQTTSLFNLPLLSYSLFHSRGFCGWTKVPVRWTPFYSVIIFILLGGKSVGTPRFEFLNSRPKRAATETSRLQKHTMGK